MKIAITIAKEPPKDNQYNHDNAHLQQLQLKATVLLFILSKYNFQTIKSFK